MCLYLVKVTESPSSTWKGLWGKLKIIGPMIWPKGSVWLQLCVVICALLLVAGRVCNLYVPIYYKHIGKYLSLVCQNMIGELFCVDLYV